MKLRSFENARLMCFNDHMYAATIIKILGHFSSYLNICSKSSRGPDDLLIQIAGRTAYSVCFETEMWALIFSHAHFKTSVAHETCENRY